MGLVLMKCSSEGRYVSR